MALWKDSMVKSRTHHRHLQQSHKIVTLLLGSADSMRDAQVPGFSQQIVMSLSGKQRVS